MPAKNGRRSPQVDGILGGSPSSHPTRLMEDAALSSQGKSTNTQVGTAPSSISDVSAITLVQNGRQGNQEQDGVDAQSQLAPYTNENNPQQYRLEGLIYFDLDKDIKNLQSLGKGSYGCVYEAEYGQDDQIVAIKTLKNSFQNPLSPTVQDDLNNEIKVMCRVDHPNCAKILGVCSEAGKRAFMLEHLGESLHSYIHNRDNQYNAKAVYNIIKSIAKGLEYLHSPGEDELFIVHGDLHTANVLFTHRDTERNRVVKIIDYNLSRLLLYSGGNGQFGDRPMHAYAAPETYNTNIYSRRVDMYALGMIAWELWARKRPFEGYPFPIIHASQGDRPQITDDFPKKLVQIITWCWKEEDGTNGQWVRPTAKQVHGMCNEALEEIRQNCQLDVPRVKS